MMTSKQRAMVQARRSASVPSGRQLFPTGTVAGRVGHAPHHGAMLARQATIGNRATTAMIARMRADAHAAVVQREDGDAEAQGPADPETWVDWAYRNRWKIAGGVAVTAGVAAFTYYYFKSSSEKPPTDVQIGQGSPSPEVDMPKIPETSAVSTGGTGGSGSSSMDTSTPTPSPTTDVGGSGGGGSHAWPQGQAYTMADKLKGMISLIPGGGVAVSTYEKLINPTDANSEALIAEIAKLAAGPYGMVAGVWDNVAKVLSYYSSGKIEIGTTIDLLRKAGEGVASAEADGMSLSTMWTE